MSRRKAESVEKTKKERREPRVGDVYIDNDTRFTPPRRLKVVGFLNHLRGMFALCETGRGSSLGKSKMTKIAVGRLGSLRKRDYRLGP